MFKGRSAALTWDILSRIQEERLYDTGVEVCKQGEEGHEMHFIKSGTMDVVVQGVGKVHTMGEGDFFGEKALLNSSQAVRTATVRAAEPCMLLTLSKVSSAGNESGYAAGAWMRLPTNLLPGYLFCLTTGRFPRHSVAASRV